MLALLFQSNHFLLGLAIDLAPKGDSRLEKSVTLRSEVSRDVLALSESQCTVRLSLSVFIFDVNPAPFLKCIVLFRLFKPIGGYASQLSFVRSVPWKWCGVKWERKNGSLWASVMKNIGFLTIHKVLHMRYNCLPSDAEKLLPLHTKSIHLF